MSDDKPAMKIENWPLEKITPYARNPRMNKSAVSYVKSSLAEFGVQQPIVVDMGSGSTLIAAETCQRVAYGCEINPRYCDIAILRWQRISGQRATLVGSDEPYPIEGDGIQPQEETETLH